MGYLLGTVLIFCGVCINSGVYQVPTQLPFWLRWFPPLGFARLLYLLAASCGNGECIQSFSQIKGELTECYLSVYLGAVVFLWIAMSLEGEIGSLYRCIRSLFTLCIGTPRKDKLASYIVLPEECNTSIEVQDEDQDCKAAREFAEGIHTNLGEYALVCKRLRKVYESIDARPKKVAVQDFSLVIPKGEFFGLLGPNGAGKTSLISVLTGLSKLTRGAAWISGKSIVTETEDANAKMGVCPQDNYLWPDLTVEEHLYFYAYIKGVPRNLQKTHVKKAIGDVKLENFANFQAKNLSGKTFYREDLFINCHIGGMQRRLSVAISLVGDPDIVFLDEPTTGLDPENRRGLWDILSSILQIK